MCFAVSSESDVTSPDLQNPKNLTIDSPSLQETASLWSSDSVFMRGISSEEGARTSVSSDLKPVDPTDKSSFSGFEQKDEHSTSVHFEGKAGLSGSNPPGLVDESSFSSLDLKDEHSAPVFLEDDSGFANVKPVDEDDLSLSALEPSHDHSAPVHLEGDFRDRTFSETGNSDSNYKRVNRLSSIEDLSHIYENFLAFASTMAERSPEFQQQLYHVYENVTQAFDFRSQDGLHKKEDLVEEKASCSVAQETNVEKELGSPSMEMSSEFEKISLRDRERKENEYMYRPYSGICGESELEKLAESLGEEDENEINTLAENKNENSTEVDLRGGRLAGETDDVKSTVELQSDEVVCSTSADVVDSSGQTPLRDENAEEKHADDNNTVQSAPTLLHADCVSAVETGSSSFYLVQEVNEQIWSEVASRVPSESVVETSMQISATAESATDQETSASLVGDSPVENVAEEVAERGVVIQGPIDDSQDDEENFSAPEKKGSMEETAFSDIQHLSEDTALSEENRFTIRTNEIEESSLQLSCFKNNDSDSDVIKEAQTSNLTPSSGNSCLKCGSIQNVFNAGSFVTSTPLESKCSMEVHSKQNILSTVCACEQAQSWDEATLQVEEIASVPRQDPGLEIASTSACDNRDTLVTEISNEPKRKETVQDTPQLRHPSSKSNGESSSQETVICDAETTNQAKNTTYKTYRGDSCEQSDKMPSNLARSCVSDSTTYLDSSSDFRENVDVLKKSPERDTDCSTKSSSDEEFATPEDTIDFSGRNNEDDWTSMTQDSRGTTSTEPVESIGTNRDHSSKSSEGPCDGHLLPATDPESDSKTSLSVSSDSCKVNANLEDKQDLTRSQMDILKAVTAAFEEILELHGDENDSDDTKL